MEMKEKQFAIKPHHCGTNGNIRVFSLMQYLQEIATIHAEELGFGFGELNEIGLYWVLSNIRIEFDRFPKWPEVVTIKTWPSGYSRLIATREFVGLDRTDKELFKAGSQWMILDKNSTRPKDLLRLDLGLPQTGQKVIQEELKRLMPKSDYRLIEKMHVPHSSIDMNGHVNNTEYIRWGINGLRQKFKVKDSIHFIQATYLSEVFEADELEMMACRCENGNFCFQLKKSDTGNCAYLMEVCC